jgi:hypothetical protein
VIVFRLSKPMPELVLDIAFRILAIINNKHFDNPDWF